MGVVDFFGEPNSKSESEFTKTSDFFGFGGRLCFGVPSEVVFAVCENGRAVSYRAKLTIKFSSWAQKL